MIELIVSFSSHSNAISKDTNSILIKIYKKKTPLSQFQNVRGDYLSLIKTIVTLSGGIENLSCFESKFSFFKIWADELYSPLIKSPEDQTFDKRWLGEREKEWNTK